MSVSFHHIATYTTFSQKQKIFFQLRIEEDVLYIIFVLSAATDVTITTNIIIIYHSKHLCTISIRLLYNISFHHR